MSETFADSENRQLTTKDKITYASGAVPGMFFQSFMGQIQTFYFAWMGLAFKYILISQILYAIWNAVNDPIFGVLQDRTKNKRGRYIPWIRWFSPFFTIAFIFVFFPPQSWRYQRGGEEYQILLAVWYLVTQILYDTGFTIVYIAHVALGAQMSMNERERTSLQIYTTLATLLGMGLSMFFPLFFLNEPNETKIMWFQICVIIFGILGFFPWIWIWKNIKERRDLIPPVETQSSLWENVKYVFKNPSGRAYVFYDGISVGIFNCIVAGITFALAWIFGLSEDYNEGWGFGNIIWYLVPIVMCLFGGVYIQLKLPIPKEEGGFGKDVKFALFYSLVMEAIGFFLAFLGVILSDNLNFGTYEVPNKLWLISLGLSIAMLGFSGDPIYHNVMRADTIDWDEVHTGERRESVYAGIGCLFSKPMISVALIMIPFFLTEFGLIRASPEDPSDTVLIVSEGFRNAAIGVSLGVFLFPAILAFFGAIAWYFYPLDKHALAELRIKLDKMHETKKKERLNEDGSAKHIDK